MKNTVSRYEPGLSPTLEYGFAESPFGTLLVARTGQGICVIEFADDRDESLARLHDEWQGTEIKYTEDFAAWSVTDWLSPRSAAEPLALCLRGTDFQCAVWEALLKVPFGRQIAYSDLARLAGNCRAVRAAASAVASNRISLIIPCHRIVRKNGDTGNYRWGTERKKSILAWERALATER